MTFAFAFPFQFPLPTAQHHYHPQLSITRRITGVMITEDTHQTVLTVKIGIETAIGIIQ